VKLAFKYKNVPKLAFRIKIARIMELQEGEFKKFIHEVENSPWFEKLKGVVIKRERFPYSCLSSKFLELKEEFLSSKSNFDIESFLTGKEKIIILIRKLGQDKFKHYFLNTDGLSLDKISRECCITLDETKEIVRFVDNFFIQNDFGYSSLPALTPKLTYYKVATLVQDGENYIIEFNNINYFKGRYLINYSNLKKYKENLTKSEWNEIEKLIRDIELINSRKTLLYQVLRAIISHQHTYLKTKEYFDLKPLTLRELARRLDCCPSHLSRLIKLKTIELPWGEEKKLKFFFPTRKKIVQEYFKNILRVKENNLSSLDLKKKVKEKFGFEVPLRTISYYRKQIIDNYVD